MTSFIVFTEFQITVCQHLPLISEFTLYNSLPVCSPYMAAYNRKQVHQVSDLYKRGLNYLSSQAKSKLICVRLVYYLLIDLEVKNSCVYFILFLIS